VSMESFYLWVLGAPIALVAVCVLIASGRRRRRDNLLAATGRRAIGSVLASGRDSDGLGSDSYWVRVQYSCDGEAVTAKVMVSRRDQQRYPAGQRVGLTYTPSRPQVVRLDPPVSAT
jgi:hypothetical protein